MAVLDIQVTDAEPGDFFCVGDVKHHSTHRVGSINGVLEGKVAEDASVTCYACGQEFSLPEIYDFHRVSGSSIVIIIST